MRLTLSLVTLVLLLAPRASAQQAPPRENPYDVISKILQPFIGVLLTESNGANRATSVRLEVVDVGGRLPQEMKGATLQAEVEFPDKVKVIAPILGETFSVCRNGDRVWAAPGSKIECLISQSRIVPAKGPKWKTPLSLPITHEQAMFLPALFSVNRPDVAEVKDLNGESCRVLTVGLMPELAKATEAEDFKARVWIAPGHKIKRLEITRRDFSMIVDVKELVFSSTLPASTWEPPAGVTDIHRTTPEMLKALLEILTNPLKPVAQDGSRK